MQELLPWPSLLEVLDSPMEALPPAKDPQGTWGRPSHLRENACHGGTRVGALVQEAGQAGGRRNIMVNNAGIGGTENQGAVQEMAGENRWHRESKTRARDG